MVGTAWKQLWVCVQPPPSHTRVDTRVLLWSVRQEQNERVHLSSLPFSLNTTQHKQSSSSPTVLQVRGRFERPQGRRHRCGHERVDD